MNIVFCVSLCDLYLDLDLDFTSYILDLAAVKTTQQGREFPIFHVHIFSQNKSHWVLVNSVFYLFQKIMNMTVSFVFFVILVFLSLQRWLLGHVIKREHSF